MLIRQMADGKSRILGFSFIFIAMLIIGFVMPFSLTAGARELGNEDIIFRLNFFSIILGISSIIVLALFLTRTLWTRDDKYIDSFGFYDLENSLFSRVFKKISGLKLFLISLFSFMLIFFSMNILKSSGVLKISQFTSTFTLQQFSETTSLLFSTLLIPISEEMLNMAVMGTLILILTIFAIKTNMNKKNFMILYYGLVPILIGFLAVIWHNTVYFGSDVGLITVFVFWWLKAILILITRFVLIGVNLHMANNFFIDAGSKGLYSSDVTIIILALVVLIPIVLLVLMGRKKEKKVF